jgi:hypothetical protein
MQVTCCSSKYMPLNLTFLSVAALSFLYSNTDTVKCWTGSDPQVYILWYEICKFCCENSFCLILLEKHYQYSSPNCITSAVTDIISYFTIHLTSWWRMMKCGFYLLWRFSVNWDLWTSINIQERLQHLHMLWWWKNSYLYPEGLSVSDQEGLRCVIWLLNCAKMITQLYGYQITKYMTIYVS